MRLVVLGAGAWGTALALLLSRLHRPVVLAPRRREHAALLLDERENTDYLPGFPFPAHLAIEPDLGRALAGAGAVLLACPTQGVRDWAQRLRAAGLPPSAPVVSLAKGLELSTHLSPAEILREILPAAAVGALSGPSNAAEVARGQPTAVTLALPGAPAELTHALQAALSGPSLRVYLSDDLHGVELAGCLKNIYAIAAGCCDGLGLGDNSKAALLTRALAEMVRLGAALGSRPETFYGLAGFGDLVATCNGLWSRNRSFGESLARGASVESLLAHRRTVVEGYTAARSFHELCRERGLDAPILGEIYAILHAGKPPADAIPALMGRGLKRE